jgi:hypothetical protein
LPRIELISADSRRRERMCSSPEAADRKELVARSLTPSPT